MIKLVAFDWNGTILADGAASVRANNKIFPKLKLRPLTLRRYQETFDIPVAKYWQNVGLSKTAYRKHRDKIEKLYHLHYEKFAGHCRTRAGVKAALRWLKAHKIESIIYSNHIVPQIIKHFPRLDLEGYFNHVIARQPGDFSHLEERGKAQKLAEFVLRHKLKPREVVSVGDTEEEMEIANHYGYHSVAFVGGWNTVERLRRHNPNFWIHNMAELAGVIKGLNNW